MTYNEQLLKYEQEKAKLRMQPLTDKQYEQAVKELARRLGI